MAKMWAGRTAGNTSAMADDFNSSIHIDSRMYREDIKGSMAHSAMLAEVGILTAKEADDIIAALEGIMNDIDSGALAIDMEAEDIHMFVESVLTQRIGDLGKKLHTARSRNDQVAVDMRLYMRGKCEEIKALLIDLIDDAVVIVLIIKDSVLLEAIYQFSFECQSSVVTAMCALLASAAYIAASTVFIS